MNSSLAIDVANPQIEPANFQIKTVNLGKVFHNKGFSDGKMFALEGISLSIKRGEFVCIVGPSGCGKTTLLRIMAGLEEHSTGTLEISHVNKNRPLNSMVFQEQSIFPWMTVEENVGFGLTTKGVDKEIWRRVVDRYISKVHLEKFAKAYPHQLSGGMKQRVSIARAFATDSEVLLMDEPFSALDEQTKTMLQEELMQIWAETKKTVVFITHSIDESILLADRVVVMTARPGRIKAELPVDIPRPREAYKIRTLPNYGQLTNMIWGHLKEEVLKAKSAEGI